MGHLCTLGLALQYTVSCLFSFFFLFCFSGGRLHPEMGCPNGRTMSGDPQVGASASHSRVRMFEGTGAMGIALSML